MKNVLILTDFSACALNATHYAIHFLKNETCCFYLMHVHKSGSFTMDDLMSSATANVYESVLKVEKEQLQKVLDELKQSSQNDKHEFHSILDYDTFLQATHRIIEEKKIDLLVAGYNGVSNVKEIIFGSHTLSIIRKINCNTLVIPEDVTNSTPKTMLVLLDEKDEIESEAFDRILRTAEQHSLHVHIVRVYEKPMTQPRYDESYLMKQCTHINYTYKVIQNVPLHYVKSAYMQLHEIDMIGLIVQKESVFERIFKQSSVTEISKALKKPLFVTHP
ncbi:universal stress protein [Kordia jejudonensis]|uniref:universal stress protein n=1 Tax=Kordia jejudonensis TaxID=1348245 RepID=UPI000629138A|nr:universal stress protein [Kordia jejudonensis]